MLIKIQPSRQNTQWRYGTGLFSSEVFFAAVWGNHQAPRYSSQSENSNQKSLDEHLSLFNLPSTRY